MNPAMFWFVLRPATDNEPPNDEPPFTPSWWLLVAPASLLAVILYASC
jgi:hypothetical protein